MGILQHEMYAVQKSISDCIDMEGWHSQCQVGVCARVLLWCEVWWKGMWVGVCGK